MPPSRHSGSDFDTCRVTGGDPVGEWQEHLARLNALGQDERP